MHRSDFRTGGALGDRRTDPTLPYELRRVDPWTQTQSYIGAAFSEAKLPAGKNGRTKSHCQNHIPRAEEFISNAA
jgi:hypothetical protein